MTVFYADPADRTHVHDGEGRTMCGLDIGDGWFPHPSPSRADVCRACRRTLWKSKPVDVSTTDRRAAPPEREEIAT